MCVPNVYDYQKYMMDCENITVFLFCMVLWGFLPHFGEVLNSFILNWGPFNLEMLDNLETGMWVLHQRLIVLVRRPLSIGMVFFPSQRIWSSPEICYVSVSAG